jgi:hypothetical protein
VDVRGQQVGLLQRADAHEADEVAGAGIVAPESDPTGRAAGDLLALATVVGVTTTSGTRPDRDTIGLVRALIAKADPVLRSTTGSGSNGRTWSVVRW